MANIALVNSARFQPFSYQELVAPVAHQQQVLDDLAEQYDKLSQQADVLEALGSNETDRKSKAYMGYKSYSDSLRKEADNLYRNGLNAASRQRLSDLRRRYSSEIVPIQNAYTKREKEALMQQEARIRNPYIRFTRDASTTPLENYMANPELGYGVVDLKNVAGDMAEMAKNLSKQLRAGVNIEGIDPYTKRIISQHGLDPNLISEWASNPNASPALTNMMNQVLAAHGLNTQDFANSPNGANILREAIGAAQRGAWSAVGEDKEQIMEDFASRLAAKTAAELDAYRGKKMIDRAGEVSQDDAMLGNTYDLNFSDAESAGNVMKRRLAVATAEFLQSSKNPEAKKLLDEWKDKGGIEAAIKHWETEGIDGDRLKPSKLYWALGNHLRKNVTGNENIINIWRSGMAGKSSIPSSGTDDLYGRSTYGGLDITGTPVDKSAYATSNRSNPGVSAGKKDWKNFNELANTGWKVKATQLLDTPEDLKIFLGGVLDRNYKDGKLALYDIKKIHGDGTYEYGNKTSVNDLPKKSNGETDYDRMHRSQLSNGDYLLYWVDDKGNTVEKVLRKQDIGDEAVRNQQMTNASLSYAKRLYDAGLITEEEFESLRKGIGRKRMSDAYSETRRTDVQSEKL